MIFGASLRYKEILKKKKPSCCLDYMQSTSIYRGLSLLFFCNVSGQFINSVAKGRRQVAVSVAAM